MHTILSGQSELAQHSTEDSITPSFLTYSHPGKGLCRGLGEKQYKVLARSFLLFWGSGPVN